ncbi:MAG: hypothetical protein J7M25_17170 [Deltaproteobacteria bacterium]|nr:hypothetical protein [Deltaproteobacteria bacterium]
MRSSESPEGLAFLHRVVLAAQFVITLMGVGGIRIVCKFLELRCLSLEPPTGHIEGPPFRFRERRSK